MQRRVLIAVGALVVVLLITEVCLRVFFGLGSPPLVYTSPKFAYAFQPNQSCKRFGHLVSYNEAGLRSEKLRPMSGGSYRVLCVGGSVTNGGAPIDQKDTYPYQLEQDLAGKGQNAQVLNASAGGWALGNEYGFLQDKGIFEARIVVLEVGTSDLYRMPAQSSAVGADANLPDHNPSTAIGELLERYLLPKVMHRLSAGSGDVLGIVSANSMIAEDYQRCLGNLKDMVTLVATLGAKPIIVLTPDKDEVRPGKYRADHRSDLSALVAPMNGAVVEMMPVWQKQLSEGKDPFRDLIHPNPDGNRAMAEAIAATIAQR